MLTVVLTSLLSFILVGLALNEPLVLFGVVCASIGGQGLGKLPSSASQHATTNQPSAAGLQELVRKYFEICMCSHVRMGHPRMT